MDGFEKLKETLLESAQSEAEAILASATAAVAVINKQSADEVWLMKESAAKEQAALEQAGQRRDLALATLDTRRADLNARQNLLDEVLQETLQALTDLPEHKKKAYYENLLRESATPGATIVCAQNDASLVAELLQAQGIEAPLTTADHLAGGLIFKSERVWEDRSFESSLRTRRDEFIEIAAGILFGKGEQT